MSIFDIFRTPSPAPVPATIQAPGAQGTAGTPTPGTQSGSGTDSNGVVPAQGTDPNKGGTPGNSDDQSPLAKHAEIWKMPESKNEPSAPGVFGNLDPAKVMESAKKVNFAQAITPENLTKIKAGGDDAVQALVESLNIVAQGVYAQNAIATARMVDQALGKAQESYDQRIPGMLKKLTAGEKLVQENPLFANPAVQPIVGALQEVLVQKNPNASSAEISQQITDYLKQLGTAFAPAPPAPQTKSPKDQDWSNFLES